MNSTTAHNSSTFIVIGTMVFLLMTVAATPMEPDDEQSENGITRSEGNDIEYLTPWDSLNTAALRKLLLQFDANERLGPRVSRSWPQIEPRGWSIRTAYGRFGQQGRTDKRQVRFRQCYFNPISCFRK